MTISSVDAGQTFWQKGQKILNSFVVSRSRTSDSYTDYILFCHGTPLEVVARKPHAFLLKHSDTVEIIAQRIEQWISLGMHPHLESCFGMISGSDFVYFLEIIDGITLRQWTDQLQNSLRNILSLSMQICHALEYLHANNIFYFRLSLENVIVNSHSLVKLNNIVHPVLGVERNTFNALRNIDELLRCLWSMLCFNRVPHHFADAEPVFKESVRRYEVFLRPLFVPGAFADIEDIRLNLDKMYQEIFGLRCPYFSLTCASKAESLNNQAVFLFESGRFKDGLLKLQQALLIKDHLPEAVYNLIVYKIRSGLFSADKILLMIKAASSNKSAVKLLQPLSLLLKKTKYEINDLKKNRVPFLLSSPDVSLAVYRHAQIKKTKTKDIADHYKKLRYEACLQSLLFFWRKNYFEKDTFLSDIYEKLLPKGDKKEICALQRYKILMGFGKIVSHVTWLPGSKKIIGCEGGDSLWVRNFGPGKKEEKLYSGGENICSVTVSPDGKIIAAGTEEGALVFWYGKTGKPMLKKQVHKGSVSAVDFSHDRRFLVSSGSDGLIVFRTLSTGREKVVPVRQDGNIVKISFFPFSLDVVSAGSNGSVKIWSARGRECLHAIDAAHSGPVTGLSIAPKGEFFVTSSAEEIKIWDRYTGDCLQQFPGHIGGTTSVLVLDDNRHLLSAGLDDMIYLWDLVSGEMVTMLDCRGNGILSLARGAHSHYFFAGQNNGSVITWRIVYNLDFC